MVASSSNSGIDRLNLTESAKTPSSTEAVPVAQSSQNSRTIHFSESSLPRSPKGRETGLVVRLFPTPPQIFGISQTQQLERDNARHGDSAETPEEYKLRPLEAEALTLSRMLKSLQPLEPFPGFPTAVLPVEPDSPTSSCGRPTVEKVKTVGLDINGVIEEQAGLPNDRGHQISAKDRSDSFSSCGSANIRSSGPKSPKSNRRNYGFSYSSRGTTPSTSIGSASELQFPAVDLRSPPSPEPLGAPRTGSPLKWRPRISSVSPVDETATVKENQETPVQGLVVERIPSFSDYFPGKVLFQDVTKKADTSKPVPVEPEPSVVVNKLKAAFRDDEMPGVMIPPGISTMDANALEYSVALEYQGPAIDDDVPKVKPIDVSAVTPSNDDPLQLPIHTSPSYSDRPTPSSRGRPVSFINPFPAWFNSDLRDRDRKKGNISPPSHLSARSVDPGTSPTPLGPRSRPPPVIVPKRRGREMTTSVPDASVSALEQDQTEVPVSSTSSPGTAGAQASTRTSEGASDDESELASITDSFSVPRPSRSFRSYDSDNILPKSEPMGLWNSLDYSGEDPVRQAGHRPRSMSLPGIQAIASLGSQAVGSHLTPTSFDSLHVPNNQQRRKGECYLCHKGHRLTDKESCLVCNAKYCYNCVLTAMESMPEGRKCRTCISKPVDEAKRPYIGKPSRLLNRLLSPQEVQQIMKAEKECAANQLRPEQLFVNGNQLTPEELGLLLKCQIPPQRLKPGRYWYDSQSGLWGKEGERPDKLISPNMKVGGILQENASNGSTNVFMNGRELGKLELKMLKLAGVHCPPSTHLWVEPDGSYQEEGQNNSKGNIWNKASIRLLYPFFSLPTPGASTRYEPPRDSPDIYMPDYAPHNKLHKILVLGHEGSGRSTLFKQTKFLFKSGFTPEECLQMKTMIQRHIYRYIGILLEGRERFEEEEEDDLEHNNRGYATGDYSGETHVTRHNVYGLDVRLKHHAEWFLDKLAEGTLDIFFSTRSSEYLLLVDELWRDPAIQATHSRKDELNALPDAAEYFLQKDGDVLSCPRSGCEACVLRCYCICYKLTARLTAVAQVVEISGNEYVPSEEDILRAEGLAQGSGLAEVEFSLDDKMPSYQDHDMASPGRYQLIKVGGKGMAEGCKWLDMFEDVHAVVFCVAISEYDQVLTDSDGVTCSKLRQKELFESVLKHPFLGEKPMVLLLNKYDLFEGKICKGIPLTSCEWFSDFRPVGASQMTAQMQAQQGYTYVVHKYKELFACSGRKLFTFKLNAIEPGQVLEAFQYVREILNWKDNNGWDLFPEESAYSTDLSSYSQHNFRTSGRDGFLMDRNRRSMEL